MSDNDWILFQNMRDEYLYREVKKFHQGWIFDDITNRFKEMEL